MRILNETLEYARVNKISYCATDCKIATYPRQVRVVQVHEEPVSYTTMKGVSPVYKLGLLERRGDMKKKIVWLISISYYTSKVNASFQSLPRWGYKDVEN